MNIILIPNNCDSLLPVKLPDPKDGKLQQYFYDENNLTLFESIKFSDQYRAWFLDNEFCKDGHFNMLTRIDPLFILLPILEKFASKQFRTLDDICSTFAQTVSDDRSIKIDYALSHDICWENVCETKQIDNELFVRYSESNTLKWLEKKFERTLQTINSNNMVAENNQTPSKITLISYARDLIDVYLPNFLSNKFKEHIMIISPKISLNIATNITDTDNNQTTNKRFSDIDNKNTKKSNGNCVNDKPAPTTKPSVTKKDTGIMRFFSPK